MTGPRSDVGERGAAALEFALVLPVFLLILFGTMAYGLYGHAAITLQHVAAEAARASVRGLTDSERQAFATEAALMALSSTPTMIDPARMTLTFSDQTSASVTYFQVRASYDLGHLGIAPIIALIPFVGGDSVSSVSAARLGGT